MIITGVGQKLVTVNSLNQSCVINVDFGRSSALINAYSKNRKSRPIKETASE